MTTRSLMLETTNLSYAWTAAFRTLMERGAKSIEPLVVTVTGFDDEGIPEEDLAVREMLDEAQRERADDFSIETVAGTLFPNSFWQPGVPRERLFARYLSIKDRLKRQEPLNRKGIYFERLIAWKAKKPADGNQLEHILQCYKRGVTRKPALQATTFDPATDLTFERRRVFPCLQQLAFVPHRKDGTLTISAFYASQFVFTRAYGNYVGLCRLGRFMAHEMGLRLTRMTCYAGGASLWNGTRAAPSWLLARLRDIPDIRPVGPGTRAPRGTRP